MSIIVPVHNEADILPELVESLVEQLRSLPFQTEILLCENGSTDGTAEVAKQLEDRYPSVNLMMLPMPAYGTAIREGLLAARGDLVIIFNADLWCTRFLVDSILLLQSGYDIVIASKRLIPQLDRRPWLRRTITASFNRMLSIAFGFRGTDTHGMKALRRSSILSLLLRCRTHKEIFDTELILRSQKAGLKICEVPAEVEDSRPARMSLLRRVPSTLVDLFKIARTL